MSGTFKAFDSPNKILVPTDFSDSAHKALRMAADLARRYGAVVQLVYIAPTTPNFDGQDFFPETSVLQQGRQAIEEKLEAAVRWVESDGGTAISSFEMGNDVASGILAVMERDHTEMVVISTHGMTGWRAEVFGSIAQKVVEQAKCTVVLLRSVGKAA